MKTFMGLVFFLSVMRSQLVFAAPAHKTFDFEHVVQIFRFALDLIITPTSTTMAQHKARTHGQVDSQPMGPH